VRIISEILRYVIVSETFAVVALQM